MKKQYFKIISGLFVIMMFQLGCDTNTTGAQPTGMANEFQIHLQTWYAQTPVIVAIDNVQVFSDTISTGSIIGIAAVVSPKVTNGTHSLRVTIANAISKDTTFTIQDTLYISANYNSQNSQIIYYFTRNRFLYD
jgi:hypothetical protein